MEGPGKRIYPGTLDRYSHGIAAAGVDPVDLGNWRVIGGGPPCRLEMIKLVSQFMALSADALVGTATQSASTALGPFADRQFLAFKKRQRTFDSVAPRSLTDPKATLDHRITNDHFAPSLQSLQGDHS